MKLKYNLIAAMSLFCLSSCYQDVELSHVVNPSLVINAAVSADTIVMASISQTVPFTDSRDVHPILDDAEVGLYVNGEYVNNMIWHKNETSASGMYCSSYYPQNGDIIKIVAKHDSRQAWAEDTVPEKCIINKLDVTFDIFDDSNSVIYDGEHVIPGKKYVFTYRVTFHDNPNKKNYYCIRIDNSLGNVNDIGTLDYSSDPVFIAQSQALNGINMDKSILGQGGRTFSDDMFQGQSYTMTIKEEESISFYDYRSNLPRRIMLYSLSESYYKYLSGLLNDESGNSVTESLMSFGFKEPVRHFSNVVSGTGILGCFQMDTYVIDLNAVQ